MKRLGALVVVLACSLGAADFWQSKPYSEWSDKDVQKMLTASPWARQVGVGVEGPAAPVRANGGRRSDTSGDPSDTPGPPVAGGGVIAGADVGGGGFGGADSPGTRGGRGDDAAGGSAQSILVMLRWQTALPLKQAAVRAKYGSEATTSPEAKRILEHEESNYVISVSGLPAAMARGDFEKLKESVKRQTSLSTKGREKLPPAEVQLAPRDKFVDAIFIFPKNQPFTPDDKEVEFSTRIGSLAVKYKFRLKDMMYNGKLEL